MTELKFNRRYLEGLYRKFNRRSFVHPDPLEFIYKYEDPAQWEIVGLLASSLAYGRVAQILKSVRRALDLMGPAPADFAVNSSDAEMGKVFSGFKHRFTTGEELARMICGARDAMKKHGSLQNCFLYYMKDTDGTVLPALDGFVCEIMGGRGEQCYLTPAPCRGSACKRMNLFLRWMVRRDEVDPGPWKGVPASKLIFPLDTHMHRIGLALGLTGRKQADLKAAVEITDAFRTISPDDPVKYDFALTRLGILRAEARL